MIEIVFLGIDSQMRVDGSQYVLGSLGVAARKRSFGIRGANNTPPLNRTTCESCIKDVRIVVAAVVFVYSGSATKLTSGNDQRGL